MTALDCPGEQVLVLSKIPKKCGHEDQDELDSQWNLGPLGAIIEAYFRQNKLFLGSDLLFCGPAEPSQ